MAELNAEQKEFLHSLYFDVTKPAAYSGYEKFFRQVLKEGRHDLSINQVKKWLSASDVYSVHKPVKKQFPHRRVLVESMDE